MPTAGRKSRHLPAFILASLAEKSMHGLALRSALMGRIPGFSADPGAIYRTLQALEADGEVTFRWDTTPPGPARKVYELTPIGWERLSYWEAEIHQRIGFLGAFLRMVEDARRERGRPEA
jgi:DNA-binding PadR family transcriptional regulator